MFAHEKLPGLPRERLLDAIEPVLRAHGLAGVEIVWRTDAQGRVLYVTVESADAAEPGHHSGAKGSEAEGPGVGGVTLDVCSRVSRDLSTAFDVLELFDGHYRLEVGSPGLERKLYTLADYRRFSGKLAKLKLAEPVAGQSVIVGKLGGVDAEGRVVLESDDAPKAELTNADGSVSPRSIVFENIRSGQLIIDWQEMGFSPVPRQRAGRRSTNSRPKRASAAHGRK